MRHRRTLVFVERIERLAAHIDEGLILAHSDQVARQRLALLLFDSAVELMMYRECTYLLGQEEWAMQMVRRHEQSVEHGYEPSEETQTWIEETKQEITSTKKRREIERFFDAKAAFLGSAGLLQPGLVRVLRRLHKYRNEAYHEDQLRPDTLDSALRIYILVICDLLNNLPIHGFGYSGTPDAPATVAKYLGNDARVDFDTYRHLARAILEREGLTSPLALGEALSEHFVYRLDEFDEALDFVAEWMSEIHMGDPWRRDDVLSLIQMKDEQASPFVTHEEVRRYSPAICRSNLTAWRTKADQLRIESDELVAFAGFADLEDAFEPIEREVKDAALSVDLAIQREVDRAVGK